MPNAIVVTTTEWDQVVLVCRKCSKKLHGGYGADGKDSLSRALKAELRQNGRRGSVRVIETKCLGLCPKGAVSVLPASAPGRLLSVPQGVPAAEILARLTLA